MIRESSSRIWVNSLLNGTKSEHKLATSILAILYESDSFCRNV